jgi:hypothetical protein
MAPARIVAVRMSTRLTVNTTSNPDPFAMTSIGFFLPRSITTRIVTQGGLFSSHPEPEQPWSDPLTNPKNVFDIPGDARAFFQRRLFYFGIDQQRVMSGLDGLGARMAWQYTQGSWPWGREVVMTAEKEPSHVDAQLTPIEDPLRVEAVLKAIEEYDIILDSDALSKLDEISSQTQIESIEPDPDGLFEEPDGHFQAVGSIYVTLNYGGKRDAASMSDSYPFHAFGRLAEDGSASVERIEVDTSSFYE